MLKARALSIRQPWAWFIVRPDLTGTTRFQAVQHRLMKDIENRCWATKRRGGFLVHAAQGCTQKEYDAAASFAAFHELPAPPPLKEVERGGIVGYAEVIDCLCTERHDALPPAQQSKWFMGEYGLRLANVHALPFLRMTGSLGFFEVEVPDDYIPAHLHARLSA